MTSREYDLFLTRSQKWALYMPAAMFTLMPILFLIVFFSTPEMTRIDEEFPPFFPWFPLVIFVAVGLFMLTQALAIPRKIVVTSDNLVTFKSHFRAIAVRPSDISLIEPSSLRWMQVPLTTYVLKHRTGKFRFPGQFTDQYLFLSELKRNNPSIEFKGC